MARRVQVVAWVSAFSILLAGMPVLAFADTETQVSSVTAESQAAIGSEDGQSSTPTDGLRYTGYVLNQAIACGCPKGRRAFLTRQANPGGNSGGPQMSGAAVSADEGTDVDPGDALARYTGYVLNQAIASGAGRASGRTLGAVTRQAGQTGTSPSRPVGEVLVEIVVEEILSGLKNWAHEVRKEISAYSYNQ